MTLVKNDICTYLNMDLIERIFKDPTSGVCKVIMIGAKDWSPISESAYNTILKYGKAEI